jgi:type II secretory pathway pseudopilin PulG
MNKKVTKKRKVGFTMIELLVVATIIIVLSAVGLVSYRKAGESSRNAKRKADLEIVRQSLVLFRADNGYYPTAISLYNEDSALKIAESNSSWVSMAYANEFESEFEDERIDVPTPTPIPQVDIYDEEAGTEPSPTPVSGNDDDFSNVETGSMLAYENVTSTLVAGGYLTETIQDPKENHPSYEYTTTDDCGSGSCSFTLTATLEPASEGNTWVVRSP